MLPRIGSSSFISTWLLVTLGASIVAMLDGGWLMSWAALEPERVWHGQVWRVFTWAFVEVGPWSIVITCASIYKFGGELAPRWGDRRLRRFILQVIIVGGIAATLCALISDHAWHMHRLGGWAVSDALIIAWARQYPNSTIRLYGFLELGGKQLVGVTIGIIVLVAISTSPFAVIPELVAVLGAAFYPRVWLSRL